MISKTIEAVYFVTSDDANLHLNPIAIRPTFEPTQVTWEDTGQGTIVNIKKSNIEEESKKNKLPEKIEIETEKRQHITLTKMTLELFNKNVRKHAAGKPKFHSTTELQEYYLKTNFDYYGP